MSKVYQFENPAGIHPYRAVVAFLRKGDGCARVTVVLRPLVEPVAQILSGRELTAERVHEAPIPMDPLSQVRSDRIDRAVELDRRQRRRLGIPVQIPAVLHPCVPTPEVHTGRDQESVDLQHLEYACIPTIDFSSSTRGDLEHVLGAHVPTLSGATHEPAALPSGCTGELNGIGQDFSTPIASIISLHYLSGHVTFS